MLLRIALLTIVTGLTFIGMGWLGPAGPVLVAVGALMGALEAERRFELDTPQQARTPLPTPEATEHRPAA